MFHVRAHEMGKKPRLRIWTKDMADYGSFEIVEFDDAEALRQALTKLKLNNLITVHRCDGDEDCECPVLQPQDSLSDLV
jgi:hypothetical protein